MQTIPAPLAQRIVVSDAYDVIAMRQEVRHMARSLNLGLIQQAKITAAISAVARDVLALNTNLAITIQAAPQGLRPALEIACEPVEWVDAQNVQQLEQALHNSEAKTLVDELSLTSANRGLLLTLRMWLSR